MCWRFAPDLILFQERGGFPTSSVDKAQDMLRKFREGDRVIGIPASPTHSNVDMQRWRVHTLPAARKLFASSGGCVSKHRGKIEVVVAFL
jgi:hypothetical protein